VQCQERQVYDLQEDTIMPQLLETGKIFEAKEIQGYDIYFRHNARVEYYKTPKIYDYCGHYFYILGTRVAEKVVINYMADLSKPLVKAEIKQLMIDGDDWAEPSSSNWDLGQRAVEMMEKLAKF